MIKHLFSVVAAVLVLFNLSVPLQAVTASTSDAVPAKSNIPGNPDIPQPIKGALDRTIQFEVVPGEEFTFDMTLFNTEEIENTANIYLRLVLPTSGQHVLFNEDITLEGLEIFVYNYGQVIPKKLNLYGRYTMQLFINDISVDFFQFDLNSRGQIIVRWDDGVMVNASAWYDGGNKWAIRGCMPDGAVLDEIGASLLSENDPFWPWPDAIHQAIELSVYDGSGPGGIPGSSIWNSGEVYVNPANSECTAFPGIAAPQPHFFVVNTQLGDYPACEGQNVDTEVNHPAQMWAEIGGVWEEYGHGISGDLMIWAIGHVGSEPIVVGTPPVK